MSILKRTIDAETARRLIDAAVTASEAMQRSMCIAIADDGGQLKAFHAMDGAAHLAIEIAQNKAYTATSFGMATHAWWNFIKDDPPLLHGVTHTPRLVVFGGGYPIFEEGRLIGGIGVSGGHYTEDMRVAEAALRAIGAPVP